MGIKNLTPHKIVVYDEYNQVLSVFESEGIARAEQKDEPAGDLEGIPLLKQTFGLPVDLPDYEEGTYLIVSSITVNAAKAAGRTTKDLLLTSVPVRDEEGKIIGCRAFAIV